MNLSLDEYSLGGLRWIVVRGPDQEAFRALGEHMRDEMAALIKTWGLVAKLREHVSGPPGCDRLASVHQASALGFPEAWAELAAFAEGCAVPFDDLALMNFRGELGPVTGGIGCSDLAWRRERSLIGHNEDGAPENVGHCALLTLALDGLPTVTAFWYPGFLPANAFTVTADGLVWTIDHLPVAQPGAGAARHFVGRGLQRSARTIDAAVDYLKTHPSAGGFAYTIGDRIGRIVNVEALAGRHASVEAGPQQAAPQQAGPLLWHTNHGRYLPGADPAPEGTSVARGQTLSTLAVPEQDPDPAWFLRILVGAPLPDGVRGDAESGDPAITLCTFIADLTAGQAVIAARDEQPVTIPLCDLAEGDPHRQRPLARVGGHGITPGSLRQASPASGWRVIGPPRPGRGLPPRRHWAPSRRRIVRTGTTAGPGRGVAAGDRR
jgi:Acyl-coenzyme A:6-aminopenicillanic acid acyl-transferase